MVAYGRVVRTGLINLPDAELELHQMPTQFFDPAVYYGILAYDNAGPQDSARSGFPRTARATRTGAINSLMARIVNDGESVREDVPPADPALRPCDGISWHFWRRPEG